MKNKPAIYLITGASGAGKSSLIRALSHDGYPTIEESGRIIVENEIRTGGQALPWKDAIAFGDKLVKHTLNSLQLHQNIAQPIFADRGLVDNLAWYKGINTSPPIDLLNAIEARPYSDPIFVLPPWQDIYIQDDIRNKSFDQALIEYGHIIYVLEELGWQTVEIAKVSIAERMAIILSHIHN